MINREFRGQAMSDVEYLSIVGEGEEIIQSLRDSWPHIKGLAKDAGAVVKEENLPKNLQELLEFTTFEDEDIIEEMEDEDILDTEKAVELYDFLDETLEQIQQWQTTMKLVQPKNQA